MNCPYCAEVDGIRILMTLISEGRFYRVYECPECAYEVATKDRTEEPTTKGKEND